PLPTVLKKHKSIACLWLKRRPHRTYQQRQTATQQPSLGLTRPQDSEILEVRSRRLHRRLIPRQDPLQLPQHTWLEPRVQISDHDRPMQSDEMALAIQVE